MSQKKKNSSKNSFPRWKQWFCNRIGAVSTDEFDEYTRMMEQFVVAQDWLNKKVGSELELKKVKKEEDDRGVYG